MILLIPMLLVLGLQVFMLVMHIKTQKIIEETKEIIRNFEEGRLK